MNQSQYDTAKDIVLDLLGWGVQPEYLVDCGLSREIVYYVFSELQLRLPSNLDIVGIIPYTPDTLIPLSLTHAREASGGPRSLQGHPSLPRKPSVLDLAGPSHSRRSLSQPPASPRAPTPIKSAPSPPTTPASSLNDIERQRRQELLARKAVQASRRQKASHVASSDASVLVEPTEQTSFSREEDVEMGAVIPTETVEDFLKTIPAPAEDSGERSKSSTPESKLPPTHSSVDAMDVDEIPGLGGSQARRPPDSLFDASSQNQASTYADQLVISPATDTFGPSQTQDPPPSSTESNNSSYIVEQGSFSSLSSGEQLSQSQTISRRGIKRPVAADFVDFGSRAVESSASLPNLIRRKTASFASLGGHRRCVIDLSDSEGEGTGGDDYPMRDSTNGYAAPAGRYSSVGNGGWATPPNSARSTRAMSPATLVEKEEEIRKMKDLIAQREQNRLKKLVVSLSKVIDIFFLEIEQLLLCSYRNLYRMLRKRPRLQLSIHL